MLNKLFPNAAHDHEPVTVEPLRPADARSARVSWSSLFNHDFLARHVERYPHLSWWVRRSGDYIVGEPWRRRSDIGCIADMQARGTARVALTNRLFEAMLAQGYQAVVLAYDGWADHAQFYTDLGFTALERIVYYEKPNMQFAYHPKLADDEISYERMPPEQLGTLIAVDHAAFPWLWWNSREEMQQYAALDNVYIYLTRYRGQTLGYFSYTVFDRWGHLDRIAVDPRAAGIGLGAAQLARAIEDMRPHGVQRVALSTQATNGQSRKLYEGFGFRLTSESYNIYGKMLTEEVLCAY